jgi:hypothetical protein
VAPDAELETAATGRLVDHGRIPFGGAERVRHVRLLVEDRRARLDRPLHVDDHVQELVVDDDQVQHVLRDVPVLGDHDRDRLADVADAVSGDDPLVERAHRRLGVLGLQRRQGAGRRAVADVVEAGHPIRGQHGEHPRVGQAGFDVDARDARVRVRAAQHRGVDHAVTLEVGDVLAVAAQQAGVLLARRGRAEVTVPSHRCAPDRDRRPRAPRAARRSP